MTRIQMDEYELCALFGIFLWRDSVSGLSLEAVNLLFQTREEILKDLHLHYRSVGITEFDITVKIGNLLLLIPKLEVSCRKLGFFIFKILEDDKKDNKSLFIF